MLRHLIFAGGLAVALAGGALAQTAAPVPASSDECLKSAFELAQKAEEKKFSNDELDKIEEMLSKMETHCDAKQFQEAMVVHKDIRTYIDTKK